MVERWTVGPRAALRVARGLGSRSRVQSSPRRAAPADSVDLGLRAMRDFERDERAHGQTLYDGARLAAARELACAIAGSLGGGAAVSLDGLGKSAQPGQGDAVLH